MTIEPFRKGKFNMLGADNSVQDTNRLGTALQTMSGLELRTVLGMMMRQWRLILALVLISTLVAAGLLSQMRYRYTAEALMSIDQRESQLVGQDDSAMAGTTMNNRVDTEVEILGSSSVALGVIDRLALWRDPEFGFTAVSRLDSLKGLIGFKLNQPEAPEATRLSELAGDMQAQLVKKLGAAVKVTRRGLTSVIAIQATSKDPEKSARVANAMAESYLDVQINAKAKTAQSAANFLAGRVDELAKTIQDVDAKIENFILAQADEIGTPEARAELQRMRESINSLATTQAAFSTQLQSLQDDPSSIAPSSVSAELRALAEKRAELARKATADSAPPDLVKQLKVIDNQLKDLAKLRGDNLREELDKSDKQKSELGKQLQDLFSHQQIPNEVAVSLYRLQREAESSRKLYDSFSTRLGEVQQQVSMALPSTRIIAPAITPHDPSYPASNFILALGCLLGLALGTAAAIARENLVGGFASTAQVEAVTGLSVLATVPGYDGKEPHDAIVTVPFSGFSESIRRLRIGLENKLSGFESKVILITSTEPSEGKSTLSISVARALATSGRAALLIDGDFRHPSISKLTGSVSPVDLIRKLPEIEHKFDLMACLKTEEDSGLFLFTTTPTQKMASDVLVGSQNFVSLIAEARKAFEYVIIDCPPIGYVVDAKIISRVADMVLYVVKQNSTSQQDAISGMRQMVDSSGHPPVAVVLNNVRDILGGYYYRNSRYNNYYKSDK
jgi:polysaccharide biosynthesis transport protein